MHMLDLNILEEVISDQADNFAGREAGIARDVDFAKYLKTKQITVISGIRRSGKSTLLGQFAKNFKNYYYINFDDERLIDFTVKDFQNLMLVFQKARASKTIFLDEIQNIAGWERFVRRIYDDGYKIFLTGSNAKLLSSELATHLTGRYVKIELYPFSFKEFLNFSGVDWAKNDSRTKAALLRIFDQYLAKGGFPEFTKYNDSEFLQRTYDDIIYKDLLVRFKIKESKAFKQLASFLFTNFTKEISYNSLKNTLGFKSVTSVKNYIEFMQESFLIFELPRFAYSVKKQIVFGKKVYVIDNGLRNNIAFYFSADRGRLLENLVFIELKRRGKELYYFKEKGECDFVVRDRGKITEIYQVSSEVSDGVNAEREVNGLVEAAKSFKLKSGFIVTMNQRKTIKKDGVSINFVPIIEWLLKK